MNLKYVSALLAAGALMAACGDDTVVNVNDEAKDKGTITLRAVDAFTGEAVPGVSVYSVLADDTEKADSLGVVTWKKNVIGSYTFFVSAEGYKTVQVSVDVDEQGQGDVSRVPDVLKTVKMYKGGVEVSGSVLYENEKGEKNPAAKVTVYANCGEEFVPSEISVTANDKGEYVFDDLPAGATCDITVGQKSFDKVLYGSSSEKTVSDLRSGEVSKLGVVTMSQIKTPLVKISDNLKKIEETTSLNISFSAELNADSVANKWTVRANGTKVLTTVTLGSDKKSIVIKPFSGKWDKDASYEVYGTVWSKENSKLSVDEYFKVGGTAAAAPAQVTGLKAAYDDPDDPYYFILTWTAPSKKPSGYNVYYKTNSMADFKFYDDYGSSYGTGTEPVEIRISYLVESSDTSIEFIVLPFNENDIEAPIAGAKAVKFTL